MKENQQVERKKSWRDEHLKRICGFADAASGMLTIGRNDKGAAIGIKDAKKLLVNPKHLGIAPGKQATKTLLEHSGNAATGSVTGSEIRSAAVNTLHRLVMALGTAPGLATRLVEMTLSEKHGSRLQQYRLTETGRALLASLIAKEVS